MAKRKKTDLAYYRVFASPNGAENCIEVLATQCSLESAQRIASVLTAAKIDCIVIKGVEPYILVYKFTNGKASTEPN